jgi:hypothetical protein
VESIKWRKLDIIGSNGTFQHGSLASKNSDLKNDLMTFYMVPVKKCIERATTRKYKN